MRRHIRPRVPFCGTCQIGARGKWNANLPLWLVLAVVLVQQTQSQVVCDGQRRSLALPIAPFPTEDTYFSPISLPPGVSCQRLLPGSNAMENQLCGGRESYLCDLNGVTFGPVGPVIMGTGGLGPQAQAPGQPEGVVPPSNPLIYSIDTQGFFTWLELTVVDVGTAGAQVVGVYGADINSGPNVTVSHEWTPNGDQGGSVRCGDCSSCEQGKGVANLTVQAEVGMGFRAIQLSSKYEDARCGGSCRDVDGIYWVAMKYSCIPPTCGDVDLSKADDQPFDCTPFGSSFNGSAVEVAPPTANACCNQAKKLTCADSQADTPNVNFPCPDGFTYSANDSLAASLDNCCTNKALTCANSDPVTPGIQYKCPAGYEYNKAAEDLAASAINCCTQQDPSCANSDPVTPGSKFKCPDGNHFKPGSDNMPASIDNCCTVQVPTCGSSDPLLPNTQFKCPAGYRYNMAADYQPATVDNCCFKQVLTCGNSDYQAPGVKYKCPDGYNYKSGSDDKPFGVDNCCTKQFQPTCLSTNEAGDRYPCPRGWAYKQESNNLPPELHTCCQCVAAPDGGKFGHFPGHFGKFGKFFFVHGGNTYCPEPNTNTPQQPVVIEKKLPFGIVFGSGPVQQESTQTVTLPIPLPFFFGKRK